MEGMLRRKQTKRTERAKGLEEDERERARELQREREREIVSVPQ